MDQFCHIRKLFLAVFLVVITTIFPPILWANTNYPSQFDYIIDTDIGGDIDDVIALLIAIRSDNKPLAVTTTHISPQEKAKIAKLILTESGYPDIPVYAGVGVNREDSEEDFLKLNPLWPPIYGYPNPGQGHKKWYEKQGLAYKEAYGEAFENAPIEWASAPAMIANLASYYSPQFPLVIIALGPLHNIDAALKIDSSIKNNIVVYSMGGNYPKGYNWLISPETTARVLNQTKTVCISSEFIDNNQLKITPEEFKQIESKMNTLLAKTIITDWMNWQRADKRNSKVTQLADPVTLYLALHSEQITSLSAKEVLFPCLEDDGTLKSEFSGCWYSMPGLENKLISINESEESSVNFVQMVQSTQYLKDEVIAAIISEGHPR